MTVRSTNEMERLLQKAFAIRATATTNMNIQSSRSHLLVQFVLYNGTEKPLAKLTLVDLASCRMLLGESIEDLDDRLGKGGRKFLKNRDKVLSVQRMSYMIAMFYEDNQAKGAKIWLEFEMVARWQPFDPQVLMDRELIETAWEQYRKMKGIQKG